MLQDAHRPLNQRIHERLLVPDLTDLLRDPQPHAAAAVVRPRHRIGEDVIESRERLARKHFRPFASFGLQRRENRRRLHRLEERQRSRVVLHRESLAAIDRNAVLNAIAAGLLECLFERESGLQVDVIVDHRHVVAANVDDPPERVVHHRRRRARRHRVIGQRAHSDPAVSDLGTRIMALQSEGPAIEEALFLHAIRNHRRRGLGVVDHKQSVAPNLNIPAANRDLQPRPFVVARDLLVHVAQSVQRTGSLALGVGPFSGRGVVDLDLETLLRESLLLKLRMKVHARIRCRRGNHLDIKFEVPERGSLHRPRVEEVRTRSISSECSINDLP